MGSDPVTVMTDLVQYNYNNKWILKTKKSNSKQARLSRKTFRFIDDMIARNIGIYWKRLHRNIPSRTWTNKGNKNDTETTYLDLDIKIIDKRFQISLYDKTDSFPFSIKGMHYLDSNIPSTSIDVEILRIGRANNTNSTL